MCPVEDCKQKHGMCGHKKTILAVAFVAVAVGLLVYLK